MRAKATGVLLTIAALMIGLATPASAKTVTIFDDLNDVAVGAGAPVEPLDLYFVDVKHTKKKLTVTATFMHRLGVSFGDRWTTAQLRLETTGDKKTDYTLMARKLNNSSMAEPPSEPIATFFYGPKDKLIAQSTDARKKNAGKFAFGIEEQGPNTLTFSVPLKSLGKPGKVRFSLWVDLTDGTYSRVFGLETYPNVKSGQSLSWSKAIALQAAKAKKKTTTTVEVGNTSIRRNQSVRMAITVKQGVAGKATIYDGSAKLGTVSVPKDKPANFMARSLSPGTHSVTVKFVPKSAKYKASTSKVVTLTVR